MVMQTACIWLGVYLALSSMHTYGSLLTRVKRLWQKLTK